MPAPYINIHTHRAESLEEVLSVRSYFLQDMEAEKNFPFTIGIHPWQVEKFTTEEILMMFDRLQTNNCIAIGETGLDKISKASFSRQREVFEIHLEYALKKDFPLIIHNVRAWNEMIKYLRNSRNIPFIFHSYHGNLETTSQLLRYNACFSFGETLMKRQLAAEVIKQIPVSLLFFETDESNVDIREIYAVAARILQISIEDLREQIFLNFNRVFRISAE